MRSFSKLIIIVSQLLFLVLVASSQETIPENILPYRFIDPENLIHTGDVIDVDFVGSTEFDWRGTLSPEGFLDGIGFAQNPVNAICRTEDAVAIDIAKLFANTLRNPKVVVKVLDRSNRSLSYIYGAIKTPQRLKIKRKIRLNELIILSGGITEKTSGEIQIVRPANASCESNSNQEAEILNIKISELLGGNEDSNPFIRIGDIITVTEAEPIYVIGGVLNPRQLLFRNKMTLTRAIASVGGLSPNANLKQISIYRRSNGEMKTILVDFEQIISKIFEDIELEKYDIVEIGLKSNSKLIIPVIKSFGANRIDKTNLPIRIID
jgi:protein involved in polysaccharide export with SLBB domain